MSLFSVPFVDRQSPVFSAFSRQRAVGTLLENSPSGGYQGQFVTIPPSRYEVQDTFLDPRYSLTAKQAVGYFSMGLGLALVGKGVFQSLLARHRFAPAKESVKFTTDNFMKSRQRGEQYVEEMNLSQGFDGLASVYMLALRDTNQRKALLAYMGASVLGYLSGSMMQGSQESWVRREETKIRAELVNNMTRVFRQSIRNKGAFDTRLKEEARARLYALLVRHQIPQAGALLQEGSGVTPVAPATDRNYFYEPTHRTVFGSQPLGETSSVLGVTASDDFQAPRLGLLKGMLVGAGLLSGLTLQAFLRLFTGNVENGTFKGRIINYETIRIKAEESMVIHGIATRQNFFIMAGFFAMSAAARAGKLFVDGLREIEVTRANARTEFAYQKHNWLSQDPAFHEIAETEALQHSLHELEQDLPMLRRDPAALKQRIQGILTNVGRNSAPKYFPMTPSVGLVMARA